jgi:hypothetical protein
MTTPATIAAAIGVSTCVVGVKVYAGPISRWVIAKAASQACSSR